MSKSKQLSAIYEHIGETLNISDTERNKIVASYEAVGNYLGNLEEELDINIYPQGSLALGTIIKPLKSDYDGDYDVDMVCLLKNGSNLSSAQIKNIVGNRLAESDRYNEMLEVEGKRCWTLQYSDFHMDILPSVPINPDNFDTRIRLTHTDDHLNYYSSYSNPKGYLKWFREEMRETYIQTRKFYAEKNEIEIEEVPLYQLRTPLQISIQLLKRHRDIMFQNSSKSDHKPISIIITTLATHAYDDYNQDLYTTLSNILRNMESYIQKDVNGTYIINNPTDSRENFADKWKEEPVKKDTFFEWLRAAKEDIIENPLNISEGLQVLQGHLSKSFGEEVINKSFQTYAEEQRDKREKGKLGIDKNGKITEEKNKMTAKMPDHTFYGGDYL